VLEGNWIRERITHALGRWKVSLADAEDLAQSAIAELFDDRYRRWDPVKTPELFDDLANRVRGLASNARRDRRHRVMVDAVTGRVRNRRE